MKKEITYSLSVKVTTYSKKNGSKSRMKRLLHGVSELELNTYLAENYPKLTNVEFESGMGVMVQGGIFPNWLYLRKHGLSSGNKLKFWCIHPFTGKYHNNVNFPFGYFHISSYTLKKALMLLQKASNSSPDRVIPWVKKIFLDHNQNRWGANIPEPSEEGIWLSYIGSKYPIKLDIK